MNRLGRTLLASALLGALSLIPHTRAFAGQPVDVSTLNPPPPAIYSCYATGSGTICRAHTSEVHGPMDTADEGGPLVCGTGANAFDIWDFGVVTDDRTRTYDRNGNLVQRVIHETWTDSMWFNPLNGASVPYTQNQVITDVFTTPGDASSAVETVRGENVYRAPGYGAVLLEVGRTVTGPDGSILFESGQHGILNYFNGDTSALDKLCAALGA